jgi:hypothetical protein
VRGRWVLKVGKMVLKAVFFVVCEKKVKKVKKSLAFVKKMCYIYRAMTEMPS